MRPGEGEPTRDIFDKTQVFFILKGDVNWSIVSEVIGDHTLSLQVPPRNSFGIFVKDGEDPEFLLATIQQNPNTVTAYFRPLLASYAWHIVDLDLHRAHALQRGQLNVWHSPESPYMPLHDEFKNNLDTCFVYSTGPGTHPTTPMNNHGNLISGICHADSGNGVGIVGVAPKVMLVGRSAQTQDLYNAIGDMMGQGVRTVFSLSATILSHDPIWVQAIDDHHAAGGLLFKSAGNLPSLVDIASNNPRTLKAVRVGSACPISLFFPSRLNDTEYSTFSAFSPTQVLLSAPGQMILGPIGNGTLPKYHYNDGTSFAAPIASAVAALILSENNLLSSDEVLDILVSTSNTSHQSEFSKHCASGGTINAYKAVLKARSLRSDRASNIFPFITFKGCYSGEEVVTKIDPVTSSQTTDLKGKVYAELGVYGQEWTSNGLVQFYAGDELLYSGPPTSIGLNPVPVEIDSIKTAAQYSSRFTGSGYVVNTGGAGSLNASSAAPGIYHFKANMECTGARTLFFRINLGNSSAAAPLDAYFELFINGIRITEIITFHDDVKPKQAERIAIDIKEFTGLCEIKFQYTLNSGTFGQIFFTEFITSPDYPLSCGFVWDVPENESRPLRLEATDGIYSETTYFEVPEGLPLNTSNLTTAPTQSVAELIGVLGSDFQITEATASTASLIGILNLPVQETRATATYAVLVAEGEELSSGSIRSPSGEGTQQYTVEGQATINYRYVNGTWQ